VTSRAGKGVVLRLFRGPDSAPQSERKERAPRDAEGALDDVELIAAVCRGDASAATALYARARPQIDRTVARLLRERGNDHDDHVQAAMIALVASLPSFRGECSLDTWTSRIAARVVFHELRHRRARRRLLDSVEAAPPREGIDLERQIGARGIAARVKRHLDAMDEVKAWTVVLHDVCGYDLSEIAEITSVSVAAAQSRLVRGRADLHARIERDKELCGALERAEEDER
jgi:RNA polymerase sigma-70 factor (ECF subfamily)